MQWDKAWRTYNRLCVLVVSGGKQRLGEVCHKFTVERVYGGAVHFDYGDAIGAHSEFSEGCRGVGE